MYVNNMYHVYIYTYACMCLHTVLIYSVGQYPCVHDISVETKKHWKTISAHNLPILMNQPTKKHIIAVIVVLPQQSCN